MAIKVGISGFGRIGRVVIRASMDMPEVEIAGINVRNADIDYLIYMLKYDTTFGRFPKSWKSMKRELSSMGRRFRFTASLRRKIFRGTDAVRNT